MHKHSDTLVVLLLLLLLARWAATLRESGDLGSESATAGAAHSPAARAVCSPTDIAAAACREVAKRRNAQRLHLDAARDAASAG